MKFMWNSTDTWIFSFLIVLFILLCFMYSQAPSETIVAEEFKRHYDHPIEELIDNVDGWIEVVE